MHEAGITAVALSPDGSRFATASFVDVAVRFGDAASGEPRGALPKVSCCGTERRSVGTNGPFMTTSAQGAHGPPALGEEQADEPDAGQDQSRGLGDGAPLSTPGRCLGWRQSR